jgi:hypothetical protein
MWEEKISVSTVYVKKKCRREKKIGMLAAIQWSYEMAYTIEIWKAYTVRGKDCSDDLGKQNFYKVTVSQDLQL